MLYLLDANVLIDANRDYYPLGRVPEFWQWLVDRASRRQVKVPLEMYEEILAGRGDDLTCWLKDNHDVLRLDEHVNETLVARVTSQGYAPDLTDEEVERVGRDPFLIAYALGDPARRTVVTTEISKPKKRRANRHIPDVCDDLDVLHCNTSRSSRHWTSRPAGENEAVSREKCAASHRSRPALGPSSERSQAAQPADSASACSSTVRVADSCLSGG